MFKKMTAKKILIISIYFLLFALIIFLTAVPVVFDWEHLDVQKWLTNVLINTGIMIVSIVLGEITGNDKLKEKVDGLYQKSLKKYNDLLAKLTDNCLIVYFCQFYIWYKARELRNKKISHLVLHGFEHQTAIKMVSVLEREDIERMVDENVVKVEPKSKKEVQFKKLNADEQAILREVFSPSFTLNSPKEYTYYLSAFNDSSATSILEKPKELEEKQKSNRLFNRIFKIAASVFISVLWGTAAISDSKGGVKAIIGNLIARLIATFGGLLSGFLTSVVEIKLESEKLDDKHKVLRDMEIYIDKKEFIPKSYDELVAEEIMEEEQEEQQEQEEEKEE